VNSRGKSHPYSGLVPVFCEGYVLPGSRNAYSLIRKRPLATRHRRYLCQRVRCANQAIRVNTQDQIFLAVARHRAKCAVSCLFGDARPMKFSRLPWTNNDTGPSVWLLMTLRSFPFESIGHVALPQTHVLRQSAWGIESENRPKPAQRHYSTNRNDAHIASITQCDSLLENGGARTQSQFDGPFHSINSVDIAHGDRRTAVLVARIRKIHR